MSYQPLKHDVRNVAVPEKHSGWSFEYRHGYGMGLERDGVYNPVSHRTDAEYDARNMGSGRSAWFAGYRAGKIARRAQPLTSDLERARG